MALAKVFKGKIVKGKFIAEDRDLFIESFKAYKEGALIEVYHRKQVKKRSDPQNKYFWSVIVKIFHDETGESEIRIHDSLLQMFSTTITDKGWYVTKGTSEMTTVEFEEFAAKCRQYGAECGYDIPEPNEVEIV